MALRIADLAVDKIYVGADPVTAVYIGADLVWQSATLKSAGMVKSGSQAPVIAASTWTELSSFTVDPTYPDTVITAGRLVASGPGTATVAASIGWNGGSANKNGRVKVNGVVVSTLGAASLSAATQSWSFAQVLATGDTVSIEAWCDSGTESRRGIGAANTFLRYTV